jgi:hypothetical protein
MRSKIPETETTSTSTAALVASVAPVKSSAFPSDEAFDAARRGRVRTGADVSGPSVGTVLGMPDGFVAAKLSPALPESLKAARRAKWRARGYVLLEGLHDVVGYDQPQECWVKRVDDWVDDREDRRRLIRSQARAGFMNVTI